MYECMYICMHAWWPLLGLLTIHIWFIVNIIPWYIYIYILPNLYLYLNDNDWRHHKSYPSIHSIRFEDKQTIRLSTLLQSNLLCVWLLSLFLASEADASCRWFQFKMLRSLHTRPHTYISTQDKSEQHKRPFLNYTNLSNPTVSLPLFLPAWVDLLVTPLLAHLGLHPLRPQSVYCSHCMYVYCVCQYVCMWCQLNSWA